ncbi:hypothetical protein B0H19DRAFT_1371411 [Mycena capillaripes]|nr:hypothetical protein B0H19DRAFT_1371411 [Mycena capillaripes]
MSVLVAGVYTSSVSTSFTSPITALSSEFVRTRLPIHRSSRFAFTVNGGPHGSFTIELACSVASGLTSDVCMGLDWKAGIQEWLIGLGLRPSNGFDHLHALDNTVAGLSSRHRSSSFSETQPSVDITSGADHQISAHNSPTENQAMDITEKPENHVPIEIGGSKQVSVVGVEEKRAFTLVVTVADDGTLAPLQAVYVGSSKRSRPDVDVRGHQELAELGCKFVSSGTDTYWSNQQSMRDLVTDIIVPHLENTKRRLGLPPTQKSLYALDL